MRSPPVPGGAFRFAREQGLKRASGLGGGLDGDVVAQGLQVADEASFVCFGVVVAGEVVRAEVAVFGTVVQDVPDDHDEGVGEGDGGLPATGLAEPAGDAAGPGAYVGA